MQKTFIAVSTVVALSMSSYAGGKFVEPVEAPIAPIVEEVNSQAFYMGLGLVVAGVSKDCPCADIDRLKDMTYGALVKAGWDFNEYIGLEARYLKASIEKDFSITTHYGLFLKPQYNITEQINIYGLIGYGRTEVEGCSYNNGTLIKNGLSYGAGFKYRFSETWALWADYQNLFHNEGIYKTKTNVFAVGVTYHF